MASIPRRCEWFLISWVIAILFPQESGKFTASVDRVQQILKLPTQAQAFRWSK